MTLSASDFPHQLLAILRQFPDGLSEHQLLLHLRSEGCPYLSSLPLSDRMVLFRSHFILFNALYHLRDSLSASGEALLEIDPLCIRLLPWQPGAQALDAPDNLRSYYLDEQRLHDTREEDVAKMLQSFWTRMHGSDELAAALELFGLEAGCEFASVRQRYRQLVSQHHPDRGGSTERIQSINLAMDILSRHYG